jgi:hypothetical protein
MLITQTLGLNRQPLDDEDYMHPLGKFYTKLFPSMVKHHNIYGFYYRYGSTYANVYYQQQRQDYNILVFSYVDTLIQMPFLSI